MDQRSNDNSRYASSLRDAPANIRGSYDDKDRLSSSGASDETWDWEGDSDRDPDEIRADIRRTRQRLDHTIDQLQDRLSLKQMVRGATEAVREQMGDPVHHVVCVIQKNPLPIALIGIGAVWLLIQEARSRKSEDRLSKEIEYSEYENFSERLKPVH